MNTDQQESLLDDLQGLLEEQMKMARKSDFRRVEQLTAQADRVVERIGKTKIFNQPEFNTQREHLTKLYKKLQLILTASKDSVAGQLKQVSNVRKTLRKYRDNS